MIKAKKKQERDKFNGGKKEEKTWLWSKNFLSSSSVQRKIPRKWIDPNGQSRIMMMMMILENQNGWRWPAD